MAATRKRRAATEAKPADETVGATVNEPPPLKTQARALWLLARLALKKASVSGIRPVLPLIEAYGRSRKIVEGTEPSDIQEGGSIEFSDEELAVLKAAGEKFAYEFIELASKSYPVGEKAYIAERDPQTNLYPAPRLPHLISAFRLGRNLLGLEEAKDDSTAADGGDENPGTEVASGRIVLLNAVRPGEYVPVVGAVKPNEIRRIAMSQRQMSLNPSKQSTQTVYATQKSAYRQKSEAEQPASTGKCGCHECSGATTESVARYDAAGKCANPFTISCETTWRLRDCLKETLCDFLFCASSRICEDGQPKDGLDLSEVLEDCLGRAACSLLHCIPNAICPPKQVCREKPRTCQPCNFAVEEEI